MNVQWTNRDLMSLNVRFLFSESSVKILWTFRYKLLIVFRSGDCLKYQYDKGSPKIYVLGAKIFTGRVFYLQSGGQGFSGESKIVWFLFNFWPLTRGLVNFFASGRGALHFWSQLAKISASLIHFHFALRKWQTIYRFHKVTEYWHIKSGLVCDFRLYLLTDVILYCTCIFE